MEMVMMGLMMMTVAGTDAATIETVPNVATSCRNAISSSSGGVACERSEGGVFSFWAV